MNSFDRTSFKLSNISKKDRYNTLVILLYFFQYGLMIPFTTLLKGQYPIIIFTLLLLVSTLIINHFKITNKTIFLLFFPLILLLLKLPFEYNTTSNDVNIGLDLIYYYLTIGVSGILIGSLKFSYKYFFNYGIILSWINFLILFLVPFTYLYNEDVNYMRFGYTLLPSVLFSFVFMIKNYKNIGAISLFVLSFSEMLVFGSRGAFLTFTLFSLFFIFFTPIFRKKVKVFFSFAIIFLVVNLKFTLNYILEYAESQSIYSYAIIKYLSLFKGSTLSLTSSGRDEIYQTALSRIVQSPFFGNPLNSSYIDTGSTYYHNIFLDILVNFGVIIFSLFILYLIFTIYRASQIKNYYFLSGFLIVFFVAMGRLLVSSSMWQRPEFWILMGLCISFKKQDFIRLK